MGANLTKIAQRFLYANTSDIKRIFNGDKAELNEILFQILNDAKYPFYIESEFANAILNNDYYSKHLPSEPINENLIRYFKQYIDTEKKIDSLFWALFHNCKLVSEEKLGNNRSRMKSIYDPKAIQIFKDFIETSALDDFIKAIIENNHMSKKNEEQFYKVSDFVSTLYGSIEEFEKYLTTKNESEYKNLAIFKDFLNKFLANTPRVSIPFDFKGLLD